MKTSQLLQALCAMTSVHALTADEWAQQSVYQVMTDRFAMTDGSTAACTDLLSFCGGSWRGIINHLDYIQGMGFTAIWISPITKNVEGKTGIGAAYHGYWQQDLYSLNDHFGTQQDLKDLSAALKDRGMYFMVDIVINNFASIGTADVVDYSLLQPFNSSEYYHEPCTIDYTSTPSMLACWLDTKDASLPDLKTEEESIRQVFYDWVQNLVAEYGVDGLRVDAIKHMEGDFLKRLGEAAGVYMIGEAYDGYPELIAPRLETIDGVMNYPAYFSLVDPFTNPSAEFMPLVSTLIQMRDMRTNTLGVFVENHDLPRIATLNGGDTTLSKNAIAFAMLGLDGIPIVFNGLEQAYTGVNDASNRASLWQTGYNTDAELYKWVAQLNRLRALAIAQDGAWTAYQAHPATPNSNTIAMRKGNVVSLFSNLGSGGGSTTFEVDLWQYYTGYEAGESVVDVISCETAEADVEGNLRVTMGNTPKIFYLASALVGTDICQGVNDMQPSRFWSTRARQ